MELLRLKCPTCKSSVLQHHTTYATQHHGSRIIYKCASCLDQIPPDLVVNLQPVDIAEAIL